MSKISKIKRTYQIRVYQYHDDLDNCDDPKDGGWFWKLFTPEGRYICTSLSHWFFWGNEEGYEVDMCSQQGDSDGGMYISKATCIKAAKTMARRLCRPVEILYIKNGFATRCSRKKWERGGRV